MPGADRVGRIRGEGHPVGARRGEGRGPADHEHARGRGGGAADTDDLHGDQGRCRPTSGHQCGGGDGEHPGRAGRHRDGRVVVRQVREPCDPRTRPRPGQLCGLRIEHVLRLQERQLRGLGLDDQGELVHGVLDLLHRLGALRARC
ncbi:Uncharacterised protein [Streptococcus pyogenes]|nr:Uncharacterised protein [Streptococcus pyogenes]